jgi:hypothetical protein
MHHLSKLETNVSRAEHQLDATTPANDLKSK